MVLPRLEHVGIVVGDLEAAKAFFAELGLEVEGEGDGEGVMTVSGRAVDRIVGLAGVRSEMVMMRTPDGHGKLELIRYRTPSGPAGDPEAPANAPGLRHILFEVADIEGVLERLRPHGAELVGEVVRYEDSFKLCYLRGPEGIIVELAERIG
ncbi:VOC family protein [Amycolatopsis sp. NPDC051716]|uniref:VOC family protein n=1 Tax=Amycolatopsis sp. NPDC051716 TaxID=3155804 RepID=UPI00342AD022